MNVASLINAAFLAHDPLEPWLSEGHWDESYWDDEARAVAERLRPGMTLQEVHSTVLGAVEAAFPTFAVDGHVSLRGHQIDAIAAECWHLLRSTDVAEMAGRRPMSE
jgi:hypothetical protein